MSLKVEIGEKTYKMAQIPVNFEELKSLIIKRFFSANKNLSFRMHYKDSSDDDPIQIQDQNDFETFYQCELQDSQKGVKVYVSDIQEEMNISQISKVENRIPDHKYQLTLTENDGEQGVLPKIIFKLNLNDYKFLLKIDEIKKLLEKDQYVQPEKILQNEQINQTNHSIDQNQQTDLQSSTFQQQTDYQTTNNQYNQTEVKEKNENHQQTDFKIQEDKNDQTVDYLNNFNQQTEQKDIVHRSQQTQQNQQHIILVESQLQTDKIVLKDSSIQSESLEQEQKCVQCQNYESIIDRLTESQNSQKNILQNFEARLNEVENKENLKSFIQDMISQNNKQKQEMIVQQLYEHKDQMIEEIKKQLTQKLNLAELQKIEKNQKEQEQNSVQQQNGFIMEEKQQTQEISQQAKIDSQEQMSQTNQKRKKQRVHMGVSCDMCHILPVMGMRYKCTVLNDYDMCESCFNKGTHPHPVIKIKNSLKYEQTQQPKRTSIINGIFNLFDNKNSTATNQEKAPENPILSQKDIEKTKEQKNSIKAKIFEIFNVKIRKTKPLKYINKDLKIEPIIEYITNDLDILKVLQ